MTDDANRITFFFDEVRRSVDFDEAVILRDWLRKTRVIAAGPLADRLDVELEAGDRQGIELDADSRVVLHELLADTDLAEHAGLKGLAQVLRGETWNEPVEDG